MTVELRIKELRKARGMTLEQLAQACGVSRGYMSEVERGVKRLNSRLIQGCSAAFGVQPHELFSSSTDSPVAQLASAALDLNESEITQLLNFAENLRLARASEPPAKCDLVQIPDGR